MVCDGAQIFCLNSIKYMPKTLLIIILIAIIVGGVYFLFQNQKNNYKIQGMKVEILKEGTGEIAKNGDTITVHYTGTLENNEKFDSSRDRGTPFSFILGAGQVIKGWDLGVAGMKMGEQRKLTIPPELAYGDTGTPGGPIPPKATLIFEVELLSISQ